MRAAVAFSVLAAASLLCAQLVLSVSLRTASPVRDLLGPPPSPKLVRAFALGDEQLLFRAYALHLQGAGDTGGRIVPVKDYDFTNVVGWLDTMAELDGASQFPVAIAVRYFGGSQNTAHVEPIVRFVQRDVARAPAEKWSWLYEAIYLASDRAHDLELALSAANQLGSYESPPIPPIASFTPALILEQMGRWEEARRIVEGGLARYSRKLSADDRMWAEELLALLREREAAK